MLITVGKLDPREALGQALELAETVRLDAEKEWRIPLCGIFRSFLIGENNVLNRRGLCALSKTNSSLTRYCLLYSRNYRRAARRNSNTDANERKIAGFFGIRG